MLSRNFNLTEPSISFVRSPVMWFYKVAAGIIPDSKKTTWPYSQPMQVRSKNLGNIDPVVMSGDEFRKQRNPQFPNTHPGINLLNGDLKTTLGYFRFVCMDVYLHMIFPNIQSIYVSTKSGWLGCTRVQSLDPQTNGRELRLYFGFTRFNGISKQAMLRSLV